MFKAMVSGFPPSPHRPGKIPGSLATAPGTMPGASFAARVGAAPAVGYDGNPRYSRRASYAALDLGTNNCRLLVAKPSGDSFIVVDAFSRIVRLGEGLASSGRISDAAIDRALAALTICADKLRRRHVALARSVATEACRQASNGKEFIDRVYRETGIALDVISAEEEARLAVLGCHILLEPGEGPALIFDIGGGSTELVLVDASGDAPKILDWQSVPWGVVSLTEVESFDRSSEQERMSSYQRMRARVSEAFRPFAERVGRPPEGAARLLGTSGTVTTLASLHLELPAYDRSAIDGLIVPATSMRAISARLAALSMPERIALPCIGRERADLVVAGCAILESILDIWPAERLGVADRGIREGILRSLMAKELRARRAHRQ
ncbi:Ppx/GppA phosphatase family protein [Pseudonocardia sp. TMWB2A]|uniref:Ppx/GppA phosphatase family protein n=1 Tax=Pseudonocardia sp. TMWB2A TaxID=687430 RepID=UPI00307FA4B2